MRGKDNKPKSLKFYLCLVGILAAAYIVMTGILAIRNPITEPETASTSVSVIESSGSSEVKDQTDTFGEDKPSGDRVGTEQAEIPESEQRSIVADDYGRGKKRYTKMEAQDVFTRVNVSVTNTEELESIVGASMDTVKSYLNVYAAHNDIEASGCEMLDYVYIGFLSERIEIYMQFNDEDSSLVTVIYEPANSTHSSRVDVLPCQYTIKEIEKKVWQ